MGHDRESKLSKPDIVRSVTVNGEERSTEGKFKAHR